MRVTRFVAGLVAGVTALGVIAGCAGEQIQALEPKLELRGAAKALGEAERAGFTIKINGSADDLVAAAKLDAAKSGDPDDALTGEDTAILKQVFNSTFTFAYDKAGDGAADDRASIGATVDGVSGTEIRVVGPTVYAKAPVAELAAKFGAGDDAPMPAGAPGGFNAFFDGKWVSLKTDELTELAQSGAGLPAQDLQQQKLATELTGLATNLLEGADLVRDENDDTHLIATTSTTKVLDETTKFLAAVDKSLATRLGSDEPADKPADKPIVLDLWIADGKLTAAEMNILQFIEGATGRVALRLEVTTGAEITAPEGATAVDMKQLMSAAMAGSDDQALTAEQSAELEELLGN